MNPYQILKVVPSATSKEIKRAYRNLVKEYHPDIYKGSDTKFKEISQAYEEVMTWRKQNDIIDNIRRSNAKGKCRKVRRVDEADIVDEPEDMESEEDDEILLLAEDTEPVKHIRSVVDLISGHLLGEKVKVASPDYKYRKVVYDVYERNDNTLWIKEFNNSGKLSFRRI